MLTSDIPIVFLDTETTSLHPVNKRIWDVGMIRREPNGDEKWYQFYVEVDLANADPFSLEIGKFWQRHPQGRVLSGVDSEIPEMVYRTSLIDLSMGDYLTLHGAAEMTAMITHKTQIIGAVPDFDVRPLETLIRKRYGIWTGHYHIIDIETLALGYVIGVDASLESYQPEDIPSFDFQSNDIRLPFKSTMLDDLLQIEPPSEEDKHTAIGDAAHVMRMYDRITKK